MKNSSWHALQSDPLNLNTSILSYYSVGYFFYHTLLCGSIYQWWTSYKWSAFVKKKCFIQGEKVLIESNKSPILSSLFIQWWLIFFWFYSEIYFSDLKNTYLNYLNWFSLVLLLLRMKMIITFLVNLFVIVVHNLNNNITQANSLQMWTANPITSY